MSRRERKMQERWTITTKTDQNQQESTANKPFLGVEFPPIAVLRRKFSATPSSSPPAPTLNPPPNKKKDHSAILTKTLNMKNELLHPSSTDEKQVRRCSIRLIVSELEEFSIVILTLPIDQQHSTAQQITLRDAYFHSILFVNANKSNEKLIVK